MYQTIARYDLTTGGGPPERHTVTRRITPPPTFAPTLRVRWDETRRIYCHAGSAQAIGWYDQVEELAKEWGVEIEVLS